ncbi:HPF/RaiA family ribosome-associated protein [Pseudomonas sp. KSR10]|jgi:ribosome-associated translation inhibitor RaiA|uniref:Ribosomal subunit interface protein n=1 Tax=Stutzerimonas stutzeri TaxID=316 RepID=A0A0D9AJT6_STUST|nr:MULTISPECIES: HPF/RaiA family ribosome-associated protein [Pseudomonadaceae]KJH79651.1 ribosomal subunit interface protein [Stutzerimonas stutzeri]MCG6541273.1 HPF/RaiA family ribosome-associated protein [Pseudomonas sp. KSR10]
MHVQVNSHHIPGSVELHEWVGSTVEERLERFDEFLTRIEVHVSDENAQKAGADDKRCQIEARPKGHQAVSVTHKADSLQLAVEGAAEKMRHALDHLMGKLDNNVLSTGELNDPFLDEQPQAVKDAMIEEDFLEKQDELDK